METKVEQPTANSAKEKEKNIPPLPSSSATNSPKPKKRRSKSRSRRPSRSLSYRRRSKISKKRRRQKRSRSISYSSSFEKNYRRKRKGSNRYRNRSISESSSKKKGNRGRDRSRSRSRSSSKKRGGIKDRDKSISHSSSKKRVNRNRDKSNSSYSYSSDRSYKRSEKSPKKKRGRKNYRNRSKSYSSYSKESRKKKEKRNDRDSHSREKNSQENKEVKEEKKRSRTRSPPRFLQKRNRNPGMMNLYELEADKPKYFWDGFQWVAKTNSIPNIDPNILNQTRKMRKVQISNLPLYMGLTENDIKQIVSQFLIDNFLNDVGNFNPVVSVCLNHQGNFAILEISSVEETNRLIKIENIKIFNNNCKITRVGESMYGQTLNLQTLVTNAQTTAQAQAAALVALNSLQKKDGNSATSSFVLGKNNLSPASSIIKVSNLIIPEAARTLTEENFDDILVDIFSLFAPHATVINGFIVRSYQFAIGAEVGCIFLEFVDKENAEKAMDALVGKKYNNKELKLIFIPEEVYSKNFRSLQEITLTGLMKPQ